MKIRNETDSEHKKCVAYIGHVSEVPHFINYFKNKNVKSVICFVENVLILNRMKEIEVPTFSIYVNEDLDDKKITWNKSLQWAEEWALNIERKDLTLVDELSILKVTKYWTSSFFYHFFRSVDAVENIFNREKVDSVILWDDENSNPQNISFVLEIDLFKSAFRAFAELNSLSVINLLHENGTQQTNYAHPVNKKVDLRRLREGGSGSRFFNLILQIKKIIVFFVDGIKSIFSFFEFFNSRKSKYLVEGASDISYLGDSLMNHLTRVLGNTVCYFKNEDRCYFNLRLIHLRLDLFRPPGFESYEDKIKLKLKEIFEEVEELGLKNPNLHYKSFSPFPLGKLFFKRVFQVEAPRLIRFFTQVSQVLKTNSIDALIISNKVSPEAKVFGKAAKNKLPIIYLPHGHNYGVMKKEKDFIHPWADNEFYPPFYTKIISGLLYNVDLEKKNGLDPEKICLGGIPKFEKNRKMGQAERVKFRDRFNFKKEEKVLLVATSANDIYWDKVCPFHLFNSFENFEIYENLVNIFGNREGFRLVLKFRPLDMLIEETRQLIKTKGARNIDIFIDRLEDLFVACDALLVTQSNVGIEALFYQIPILQYLPPGKESTMPLIPENASIKVENIPETINFLKKLVEDKEFRNIRIKAQHDFLERNLPQDGLTASQRIGKIIEELTVKGK
jgi:hypothetical protein